MNFTVLQTPCLVDGEWRDLTAIEGVAKTDGRTFTKINIDGTNYTAPDECFYKMMFPYASALMNFMEDDLLDGICTYNSRQGTAIQCGNRWWLSSLYQNKEATFYTLNSAFDQFATAMTNVIRSTSSIELVKGEARSEEVYVEVRYVWLVLPLSLLFLTCFFLATTILKTSKEKGQVLKTSAIATLLYGLPDNMQDKLTRTTSSKVGTPRARAKVLVIPRNGFGSSGLRDTDGRVVGRSLAEWGWVGVRETGTGGLIRS